MDVQAEIQDLKRRVRKLEDSFGAPADQVNDVRDEASWREDPEMVRLRDRIRDAVRAALREHIDARLLAHTFRPNGFPPARG